MIGIYKIKNKINGKEYIGQSNNIERRFLEHKRRNDQQIDQAITKYGIENFDFEIVEECEIDKLDEREEYWTTFLNTVVPNGYNIGIVKSNSIGEQNSMSKLTNADILKIRECYKNKTFDSAAELARQLFPDMNPEHISQVFYGKAWTHLYMDVYTKELADYYLDKLHHSGGRKPGELNPAAILSEDDVILMRALYQIKQRKEIVSLFPQYKERTIISVLSGQNWKHLPIYQKQNKIWTFPNTWEIDSKIEFLNKIKEIINGYI